MNLSDYILLGLKNIWRRKSRSFLTILAVVIGTISIIIMLSLVLGAKQIATQQLESINGLTLVSVSANPEMQASGGLINSDSSGEDSEHKLNDTTVELVRKIPHVTGATPIVGVWVKSVRLATQDKKYRMNLVAYDTEANTLKIPVGAGRSLQSGDMDKIVIGGELLRNFGYSKNPQDIIGQTVVLYTNNYVDWGVEPPKPPENTDDKYWESIQRQSIEINATIVGVVTSGFDEGQNYITIDWGRRLMTGRVWKYDDTSKRLAEDNLSIQRKELEQKLQAEQEAQKKQLYEQMANVEDSEVRQLLFDKWNEDWKSNFSRQLDSLRYNSTNLLVLQKDDQLSRNGYGSILLRVDNTANIELVGKEVKSLGLGAQTAKDMLDEIEKIFGLIGLIIGAIGGIVLFVASLGIINTMIMATYERTREIGIMRACGATRSDIRNLFVFEAGLLGFLGGMIGLILSIGLARIGNTVGNQIAAAQGVPITNIISFSPVLVISVLAITTLIGILAGLFPAIRASRLDPVEALRYE
jgi:ABC-type antimicrobial peptide transport system permease subunit